MFKNIMKALEEIRQQVNGLLQQREQDYEKAVRIWMPGCGRYRKAWKKNGKKCRKYLHNY